MEDGIYMPQFCKKMKLEEDKLAKLKRQNAAMVLFHQTAEAADGLFLGKTSSILGTCVIFPRCCSEGFRSASL